MLNILINTYAVAPIWGCEHELFLGGTKEQSMREEQLTVWKKSKS